MNDDPSSELRPDLLEDFYVEADEHLGHIRTQLARLEGMLGQEKPAPDVLESIFRSIHSLKGISAMAGVHSAEQLAHAAEDYLRRLSRQTLRLTADGLDVLVATLQRLEEMISAHRLRQPQPDAADLVAELGALVRATDDAAGVAAPVPPDPMARLAALQAQGLAPWQCTFAPTRELDQRGVNINVVRGRLAALGEIVSGTPAVRADGSIAFEFQLGLRETPADLAAWQDDGMTLRPLQLAPAPAPAPAPVAASDADRARSLFIAPSHLVRVDLSRLDELMRITGEMVIHRSRLEERINQMAGDPSALREVSHGLARSLRELRTAITRVRLVPIAEIFTRMPFVVRDLARETGRSARLVVEGQQTEIDKYLVERLKEPLLHLVRNAFSHGVEMPEQRVAAGKPAEATIVLRATAAGEFVNLQVRDDGRGIEPSAVARRASELGIPVPESLDPISLLRLLCTPGFSTRDEADRAAGRGVGMAVVHDTVRELGGTVSLESDPGRGTCFTLKLPLTLSIAESIIVSAADHTCAVPQGFIDEILQIPETEVRRIKQTEVIPYRDGVLPLLRLRGMFGLNGKAKSPLSILVLTSERGSTGLVVDRVHAQREIVVRPMQDPLIRVPGVSGATELGDGRPVLILDPVALTSGVVRHRGAGAGAASN